MSHGPPSLLDEKTSWAEFGRGLGVRSLEFGHLEAPRAAQLAGDEGKQHLDRRLTKAS